MPLLFVITISATREAYEDFQRYRADSEINNKITTVIRQGRRVSCCFSDVRVGDILCLSDHDEIPADAVILHTVLDEGLCHVETSNLDGESNLKPKYAIACTQVCNSDFAVCRLSILVQCEDANINLHQFHGKVVMGSWIDGVFEHDGNIVGLGLDNIIFRGCYVKNTPFLYALVVYTGEDTKLIANQQDPPSKFSTVETRLNYTLLVIFIFQVIFCIVLSMLSYDWRTSNDAAHWYLQLTQTEKHEFEQTILDFLTYIVLLNYMVPISLYVTAEMCKAIVSYLIANDLDLYDSSRNQAAIVKTSNLLDELGIVNYVFTDKTGTLTENVMNFKKCSIRGQLYQADPSGLIQSVIESDEARSEDTCSHDAGASSVVNIERQGNAFDSHLMTHESRYVNIESQPEISAAITSNDADFTHHFWLALSICHTVHAELVDGKIEYKASSSDEEALVLAANKAGYRLVSRSLQRIVVDVHDLLCEYKIVDICHFDSTRKMMTVVVEDSNGHIFAYSKGADSSIMQVVEHSSRGSVDCFKRCGVQIHQFATEGYRTLCVAFRTMERDECQAWRRYMEKAKSTIGNREKKMLKGYRKVEHGLTLLGVTAIEDCLQEGVPETLGRLFQADIKVWMLTGDKLETAVNIGKSCGFITQATATHILTGFTSDEVEQSLSSIEEKVGMESVLPAPTKKRRLSNSTGFSDLILGLDRNARKLQQTQSPNDNEHDGESEVEPLMGNENFTIADSTNTDSELESASIQQTNERWSAESKENRGAHIKEHVLVVAGESLSHLLQEYKSRFLDVSGRCRGLICCRMSPLQKALVVRLVKRSTTNPVCLSIGDGGNDVSMIQEADVGIGIVGNEGRQAVRAADYGIARFRYLSKLLLVHGRWCYRRMAFLIQYSYYKNCAFVVPTLMFAWFSGFTGQPLMDPYVMMLYNIFYTSLPVFLASVFERDLDKETLMNNPDLYCWVQKGHDFNEKTLFRWIVSAIWHGAVLFVGSLFALGNDTYLPDGLTPGLWDFGTTLASLCVVTVNLKFALEALTWTKYNMLAFWISLMSFFAVVTIQCSSTLVEPLNMYGVIFMLFRSAPYWLLHLLLPFTALAPDIVIKTWQQKHHPTDWQRLRSNLHP
eukprot:TRINITY_DN3214_c0_g1_i1.p1 TRINITY_DN3214_c0_g1~~TRINITY_DN3214_c0_g1_i1.p1  ORF type:complete len:1121 (-),score=196.54 TRINITY_DN3214_c0_g1_i1:311-3673(-)